MKLEFKILHTKNADDMMREVNEHLAQGWQLAGSMTTPVYYNIDDDDNKKWFYEFFQPILLPHRPQQPRNPVIPDHGKKPGPGDQGPGKVIFGPERSDQGKRPPVDVEIEPTDYDTQGAAEVEIQTTEVHESEPQGRVVTGPDNEPSPKP